MTNQNLEIALTKIQALVAGVKNQEPSLNLYREIIRSTIICAIDSKSGYSGQELRISGVDTIINGAPTKCISVFTSSAHAQAMHKLLKPENDPDLTISNQLFLKILMLGSNLNSPILINPNAHNYVIPPSLASHLLFAAALYESDLLRAAEEIPFNAIAH
ncbi:hypothetical protein ICN48_06760 [Polynucleobacter sp. JS-Safj-400b-B2]|uniref:hypothetical protein n=1 Tax=Polynucleobacter sp. JS-Safj-400b-B2 TaxID=2576921 RepID=UPI001C0E7B9F|nr:hypothetical protein [Polynucleobacter sp. JS-Safj-400b-B2]MBU3625933.1 hypothetical protein [Polynucleobacter sp. JS-Safj-400b-B2]